ncbi:DUF5683 domain-containing protein [Balneolales bacterium ANBcel1]|nr:DUF5683 domain-containing protein [Balneolales bacterium ANBcel1]
MIRFGFNISAFVSAALMALSIIGLSAAGATGTVPGAPTSAIQPEQGAESGSLSIADLRSRPILPGPRHVSLRDSDNGWNSGFMASISNSPGYAFLASAALPGLGQAANRQWWKTAVFVTVEATAIGLYLHRRDRGRDGERYYESYGDEHWSVVKYAQYVVENHRHEHGTDFEDLLNEGVEYDPDLPWGGIEPAFDTDIDWAVIDREALNAAERRSLYANGRPFSHTVEPYGGQQYYELMSKYYQFGPGWRQWETGVHNIDEQRMPEDFLYHAQIGYDFNDDLNVARNMLTILLANHFIAAFDAYFTQQLRRARVQPTASMDYGVRPTIGFEYRF